MRVVLHLEAVYIGDVPMFDDNLRQSMCGGSSCSCGAIGGRKGPIAIVAAFFSNSETRDVTRNIRLNLY